MTRLIGKLSVGGKSVPIQLVKYYAAEIISALKMMHSKFIIHRDLKPENILVADDWHLKIVSFLIIHESDF